MLTTSFGFPFAFNYQGFSRHGIRPRHIVPLPRTELHLNRCEALIFKE